MGKGDDKDKNTKSGLWDKAKMGVALGVAFGGAAAGVYNAHKGKTPTPESIASGYQKSEDLARREKNKKK